MDHPTHYSVSDVRDAHTSLITADQHRENGEIEQAQNIYEQLLNLNPDYATADYSLSQIHMDGQNWSAALRHLQRAAMRNPGDWAIMANLGKVYLNLNATEFASRCLEMAQNLNPGDPDVLSMLGETHENRGDFASAAEKYNMILATHPDSAVAVTHLANCYVLLQRFDDAERTLASALKMPLSRGHKALVYYLLSELPGLPAGMDLLAAIEEMDVGLLNDWEITPNHIAYAHGATLHKLGRHEDAWHCWVEINRKIAGKIIQQRETYFDQSAVLLGKAKGWKQPKAKKKNPENNSSPISLFILGASRSGKSSLETLASSRDGVKPGYEHGIATSTATRVSQRAGLLTVDLLANLPGALNDSISAEYNSALKAAAGDARALTITHHGAIYDVGRLAECVPNARFIFVKRDEDDLALRIFSKLYAPDTNQFAYDIQDIYRYISEYHQMIDNWLKKLGGQAILISYEDMAENPQSTLDRVSEFCGLEMPSGSTPEINDDRGYASPYRKWLHAERD